MRPGDLEGEWPIDLKKGTYDSDGSDDGGNKTLRGFVLIRKSHGEKNRSMTAEHSYMYTYIHTYSRGDFKNWDLLPFDRNAAPGQARPRNVIPLWCH